MARNDSPKMTRAHYQFIADQIRDERAKLQCLPSTAATRNRMQALVELAERFAGALRATNGLFDRARFERACDPAGGYRNRPKMGCAADAVDGPTFGGADAESPINGDVGYYRGRGYNV